MSPENQGVFQLLKEVNFRGILTFYKSRKWGLFGIICSWLDALWLARGIGPGISQFAFILSQVVVSLERTLMV